MLPLHQNLTLQPIFGKILISDFALNTSIHMRKIESPDIRV